MDRCNEGLLRHCGILRQKNANSDPTLTISVATPTRGTGRQRIVPDPIHDRRDYTRSTPVFPNMSSQRPLRIGVTNTPHRTRAIACHVLYRTITPRSGAISPTYCTRISSDPLKAQREDVDTMDHTAHERRLFSITGPHHKNGRGDQTWPLPAPS